MTQPLPKADVGHLLTADAESFQLNYNHRSFLFDSALAHHPMFALPRLATIAQRMLERGDSKKFVALGGTAGLVGAKFRDMPPQERLAATIDRVETAGVWIKLTSANIGDPEYADLLQQFLREVEQLAGISILEHVTWAGLTVFLASPGMVTPYHIDHESNFLAQISGEKDIWLYDQTDRSLLSEVEIEQFYGGDFEAARRREGALGVGTGYRLIPGKVVHHPPLAPHRVANGDNVSVSASFGFCLHPLDLRARVYQANYLLRRFGLRPTPPGRSALRDGIKMAGLGMLSKSNPVDPDEIVMSALTRLRAPRRLVKNIVGRVRGARSQAK